MNNIAELEETLIAAIQERQLRQTIRRLDRESSGVPADVHSALDEVRLATTQLDDDVENEIDRVRQACAENGVGVLSLAKAMPDALTHGIALTIEPADASKAATLVEQLGYESPEREKPDRWNQLLHFFDSATFWSTTGTQFHIALQWDPSFRMPGRLGKLLKPSLDDLDAISLPGKMWPGYYLVRLVRRAIDGKKQSPVNLGPFLGTPSGLIEPLLRFSGLQAGQQLVDLGCGDGRVLLAAAEQFSGHAVGYETDLRLLRDARAKVTALGLEENVKVIDADARSADVSHADVVFVFLPIDAVASLLPGLLGRMKPGAVVIAHEQEELRVAMPPIEKLPIVHSAGVTIAHKWQVGAT